MAKIIVQDTEITVSNVNGEDYICITDMLNAKDGDFFVSDWLRNRNTMEFLGVWERIYNPNFNVAMTCSVIWCSACCLIMSICLTKMN